MSDASTGADSLVLTAAQLDRLNTAAVAMLDPLAAQPSSPPGHAVQLAGMQEKIRGCAATATELALPGFAELANRVAAHTPAEVDATLAAAFEAWVELAVAFCTCQLGAEQVGSLLEQSLALAAPGEGEPDRDALLAGLASEAGRLQHAGEQLAVEVAEQGPEVGSDELDMLAQACTELAAEMVRLEHAAPHQVYSLISERAGYFANAMRYMGLEPLANLFEHLIGRLHQQVESGAVLDEAHHEALLAWPQRWADWFARRRPGQLTHALALHELPLWHAPQLLALARASVMRLQLVGSRRIERAPDDVEADELSLEIAQDADHEVVDNLLRELPALTIEFTDAVTEVATGNGAQMGNARRVAHTIKGAANTVDVIGVANLTHALEDLLQLLEQAGAAPDKSAVDILCEASDCLAEMVESLIGMSPAPTNSLDIYRRVLAEVNRFADELEARFQDQLAQADIEPAAPAEPAVDDDELGPLPPEVQTQGGADNELATMSLADFDLPALDFGNEPDDTGTTNPDNVDLLFDVPVLGSGNDSTANWMDWEAGRHDRSARKRMGRDEPFGAASEEPDEADPADEGRQPVPMLRVFAPVMERLLQAADEAVVAVSELRDVLNDINCSHRSMRDGSDRIDTLSVELDRLIDAAPMLTPQADSTQPGELDPLELERYTEIHTVSRRITEVAADSKLIEQQIEQQIDRANGLVDKLDRVQSVVRDGALRARMVDAGSIASRLQRAARQAARACDKQIQLTVHGGETAVDGETLQRVVDSLAHLVRNAVDHGIEAPSARRQAGKPTQGEITVTFEREVSAVTIIVEDDGAGLDLAAIERRARSLGLLPDGAPLDSRTAGQLILAPGFTTRTIPTQLSGRGIGLDVVNQTVRGLRGVLTLYAEPGAGTRFELKLPLQLTSLSAFLMRSETHVLALSVRGIEKILANLDAIEHLDDGMRMAWAGRRLEVRRLDEVLGLPAGMLGGERGKPEPGEVVLVVRLPAGEPVAVLVPEPGQAREVVVRSLPDYMPRIAGTDGVAVLGDGAVAPVIDLPEMLAATAGARPDPRRLGRVVQPMPVCLVVDDSVSVRRAMAHFMLDLGLYCDAAGDGRQALQMVARRVPDLIVIDLEMPRMNGIELAQALRREPATRDVPIVMITSRHSEKHRTMAMAAGVNVFMTKPYTEDELASVVGSCLAGSTHK